MGFLGSRRRSTSPHRWMYYDAHRTKRAGTSSVNALARRSWKGRSLISRAIENGPAFCQCLCVQASTQRSAGPLLSLPFTCSVVSSNAGFFQTRAV